MESAPLTLAHTHARNASVETQKANPIAASEEHDLAAGEFASAAKSTKDPEALRILKLLEQHHSKLAELLKAKPDSQTAPSLSTSTQIHEETIPEENAEPIPKTIESSPRHVSHHVPTLQRESSSSLASNLASARGIPANRQRRGNQSPAQVNTQNAEGRVVRPSRDLRSRDQDMRSSRADPRNALRPSSARIASPTLNLASSDHAPPPPITTAGSEDGFARFYSTLNSIKNTISAPLAFAGLPLAPQSPESDATSPSSEKPPSGKPQLKRISSRTTISPPAVSPDLNRLFSRAALRALRDERGNPASDSFYVVPTSGGTMSYANMLTQHARQASDLTSSADDFVDAHETPQPASPTRARRADAAKLAAAGIELDPRRKVPPRPGQTYEELYVENGMLKAVSLDLADRLRAFELQAQKSSLALHASMRQYSSPTASMASVMGGGGKGGGGAIPPIPGEGVALKALDEKVRELEEQVRTLGKENKRLGRENQKLMGVVERYREKWEILKEGARERIKGKGSREEVSTS